MAANEFGLTRGRPAHAPGAAPSLTTVDEVIAELGGIAEVAKLARCGVTAVCNWRARGRFPTRLYVLMTEQLKQTRATAPLALWGQDGSKLDRTPAAKKHLSARLRKLMRADARNHARRARKDDHTISKRHATHPADYTHPTYWTDQRTICTCNDLEEEFEQILNGEDGCAPLFHWIPPMKKARGGQASRETAR